MLYYQEERIKLYNGDCLQELDNIQEKIDLVITDPPYFVINKKVEWDKFDNLEEYLNFLKIWYEKLLTKMKENSSIYIFFSQKFMKEGMDLFNPDKCLIWHHPNLAFLTNKTFLYMYDVIFYITIGKSIFNASFIDKENVDVFTYAKPQSNFKKDRKIYGTQKPLELIKNFVKISSNEEDMVLDCFAGSGTTLAAAKELKRNAIGIEISKETCDLIVNRIKGAK